MNALADKVKNHACISSTPVGTKFTATYVGKVVTLCAYAQQGYYYPVRVCAAGLCIWSCRLRTYVYVYYFSTKTRLFSTLPL